MRGAYHADWVPATKDIRLHLVGDPLVGWVGLVSSATFRAFLAVPATLFATLVVQPTVGAVCPGRAPTERASVDGIWPLAIRLYALACPGRHAGGTSGRHACPALA